MKKQQVRIYETFNPISDLKKGVKDGLMTLSGVFGVCGVRNNNKRVYEARNYGKMVEKLQERINEEGGIPGELEHPEGMNITLANISHKVTEISIDNKGVVSGTIQLLNTPNGKIAQSIVEGGLPLYVSSRAVGSVDKQGNVVLENIATYDLVGTPGFSEAKMHLNESLEVIDNISILYEGNNNDMKQNTKENTFNEQVFAKKLDAWVNEHLLKTIGNLIESKINTHEKRFAGKIDEWMTKHHDTEFAGKIDEWMEKHHDTEFAGRLDEWMTKHHDTEFAGKIDEWMEKHHDTEFAGRLDEWVNKHLSKGIDEWVNEHLRPDMIKEMKNYINNDYSNALEGWLNEHYTSNKQSSVDEVKNMLTMLEGMEQPKPSFGRTLVNENVPAYIANMPSHLKPLYEAASADTKDYIAKRARLYNFSVSGALERFWESVNFEDKPVQQPINEDYERVKALLRKR